MPLFDGEEQLLFSDNQEPRLWPSWSQGGLQAQHTNSSWQPAPPWVHAWHTHREELLMLLLLEHCSASCCKAPPENFGVQTQDLSDTNDTLSGNSYHEKLFPFVKTKRYHFLKPAASSLFSSKTSVALSEGWTKSTRAADILWSIILLM